MMTQTHGDHRYKLIVALMIAAVSSPVAVEADELLVGTANVSITPSQPVALAGQIHTRIARDVESIRLPVRMVTEKEFTEAKAFCDSVAGREKLDPRQSLTRTWSRETVDRFEQQKTHPHYTMELHAIRLGDVAVCTNPFELYTEYGLRIKARSRAVQTFVVQLACDSGGYVPTEEAVRGGHYSTAVYSNLVGPEGGNVLVDKTVDAINSTWEGSK